MAGLDFSDEEDGPITFSRSTGVGSSKNTPIGTGHPSCSQLQPNDAASLRGPSRPHSSPSPKSAALTQIHRGYIELAKGSHARLDPTNSADLKCEGSLRGSGGESGSKKSGKADSAKAKVRALGIVSVQEELDGVGFGSEEAVAKREANSLAQAHSKQEAGVPNLTGAPKKDSHRAQSSKVPPLTAGMQAVTKELVSSAGDDGCKPSVQLKQVTSATAKKRPADVKLSDGVKRQKASTLPDPSDSSESGSEDDRPIAKVMVSKLQPPVRLKTKGPLKIKGKEKVMVKRKRGEKMISGSKNGDKSSGSGDIKWKTLQHAGVIFPPEYSPHGVRMLYDGKPVYLTPAQEEVATMFAIMKDTDYAQKPKFCQNFWADWKKTLGPGHVIKDLNKCDFTPIYQWHLEEKEKKRTMSTEEKKRMKEEKSKAEDKFMWAIVDGVKEKVGNFRVEPPGLFRGRGEHPKMGKLKRRILPEDVVINIGRDAKVPPCPLAGHRWKEVKHDQTVTWLAYWKDPISTSDFKYVFLAPSSSLKGESDREKYEKARRLKEYIEKIRMNYTRDFDSKDDLRRQTAVATYLIDRLALRAGNEKGEDEADTVGCCSLKVENVKCIPPSSLEFDFLGKDSIRYFNTVEVEPKVYKAISDFSKGKKPEKSLFDQLDTSKLNKVLQDIMPGLTAKVFRTYNASITLDRLLQGTAGTMVAEKAAEYNRANKEVAILCNHQKSVSKNHSAQIEKLTEKMDTLKRELEELEDDLRRAKQKKPPVKRGDGTPKKILSVESLEKRVREKQLQVKKKELEMSNREEMKTVALGTSKINYMDPRITVAWCKKHEVPIEKMFNKSLLAKFAWAMDVEPNYRF